MDIYCPLCAEPVEIDYLHDVADERDMTFAEVRDEFQSEGCVALLSKCNPSTFGSDRGRIAAALYDILGDDIDGAAAMLDALDTTGVF